MADATIDDVMKLPEDTRKALEDMGPQMTQLENSIKSLKKLGMDTSTIERQLKITKEQREILLTEFG